MAEDVIAPTRHEHKNVAIFDDAFERCYCATCGSLLVWLPPEGEPWHDSSSENEFQVEVWYATCPLCQEQYQLQWIIQRPSDHTTAYGYIKRITEEG